MCNSCSRNRKSNMCVSLVAYYCGYHGCNFCTRLCISLLQAALSITAATAAHVCVSRCCMLLCLLRLQLLHTCVCLVVAGHCVCHSCNCCTHVCVSLLHVALSVTAATVSYVSVSRRCILRWLSRLQSLHTSVCLVVACYCLCLSRLQLLHTCVSVIVVCSNDSVWHTQYPSVRQSYDVRLCIRHTRCLFVRLSLVCHSRCPSVTHDVVSVYHT